MSRQRPRPASAQGGQMYRGNGSTSIAAPLRLTALLVVLTAGAAAQERLYFIGTEVDKDSADADTKLYKYLERHAPVRFDFQNMPYEAAIHKITEWNNQPGYLAHMTPYACVAAAMLGAKFDVLATYKSAATKDTVYHSYFVVNSKNFPQSEPDLSDVLAYLRKNPPRRFLYHEKFSTSSYFLPSLFFRGNHIFAMSQSSGKNLTPIEVEKVPAGKGSSYLVEQVAKGDADLAAVWDGTKSKFEKEPEYQEYRAKVRFIQLEGTIPNDLLVSSASLTEDLKNSIRQAIRSMQDPAPDQTGKWSQAGDFLIWQDIRDASEALEALAALRRSAFERPALATVRVQAAPGAKVPREYLDAAEQAVRLSGSEFVVFDPDFHKRPDVNWTLNLKHDGALVLASEIEGFEVGPQEFTISFMDSKDLTQRITALIHSQMHRIRYVWPYEEKHPVVIRDVDFTPDSKTMVERISWRDLETNEYEEDSPFSARILNTSDPDKFQLADAPDFPRSPEGAFYFEPMSNVAYRVVLLRPAQEWPLMRWLTEALVGVFLLTCAGLVLDLRRKRPPPVGFRQTYQALLDRYHERWRRQEIAEADVVWCSSEVEQFIHQIQGDSAGTVDNNFSMNIPGVPIEIKWPLVRRILRALFPSRLAPELIDPAAVGSAAALERVIQFLVVKRRLAPFMGRPAEWDALDEMASRNFAALTSAQKHSAERKMDAHVQRSSRALSALAATHFREVLQKCQRDASFFCQTWQVEKKKKGYRFTHQDLLDGEMRLAGEESAVRAIVLEFEVPPGAEMGEYQAAGKLDAWLLGKVVKWSPSGENGSRHLSLSFKPLALLRCSSVQN